MNRWVVILGLALLVSLCVSAYALNQSLNNYLDATLVGYSLGWLLLTPVFLIVGDLVVKGLMMK